MVKSVEKLREIRVEEYCWIGEDEFVAKEIGDGEKSFGYER